MPNRKHRWNQYLLYISIFFLVIALTKNEYLFIPHIYKKFDLVLSIALLCLGYIINAAAWKKILLINGCKICMDDSVISIGIHIFNKYIPGKIWTLIGPASYLSQQYYIHIKELIPITIQNQLIILWTGLIVGSIGLFSSSGILHFNYISILILFVLSISIFTGFFHKIIQITIKKLFNKLITIPLIPFSSIITALPLYFLSWGLWCLAFYFFSRALTQLEIDIFSGFGFAWAATLGILVIFAPGGIGVREALLVGYLTRFGVGINESITISVMSRLWFMCGECFMFFIGILLYKYRNKTNK